MDRWLSLLSQWDEFLRAEQGLLQQIPELIGKLVELHHKDCIRHTTYNYFFKKEINEDAVKHHEEVYTERARKESEKNKGKEEPKSGRGGATEREREGEAPADPTTERKST